MKIGIDLDEVVFEFVTPYLAKFNLLYRKDLEFKDIFSFDLWVPLEISKDESLRIVKELYASEEFENLPFINGAKEVINRLLENHEVYFITARPNSTREKTFRNLNKGFDINKIKVLFSSDFIEGSIKRKHEICVEKGIEILIEDNKEYALNCAREGIRVLLLDKPWNQGVEEEGIKRVHSWEQIGGILNGK